MRLFGLCAALLDRQCGIHLAGRFVRMASAALFRSISKAQRVIAIPFSISSIMQMLFLRLAPNLLSPGDWEAMLLCCSRVAIAWLFCDMQTPPLNRHRHAALRSPGRAADPRVRGRKTEPSPGPPLSGQTRGRRTRPFSSHDIAKLSDVPIGEPLSDEEPASVAERSGGLSLYDTNARFCQAKPLGKAQNA